MSLCEFDQVVSRASREIRRELLQRGLQPNFVGAEEHSADDCLHIGVVNWDARDVERPGLFP